jgi:5-methylcytosine-specific restriction endonuclease McrA
LSSVFVLDTNKQPLNPVHPGWARKLLKTGRAAVYKRYPFTTILKVAVAHPQPKPLRLKIDPGSRTTGIAVVNDDTGEIEFAAELQHRGYQIKERLESRSGCRRNRRTRKLRYRKKRFDNRKRPKGWLPPSLMSRVHNIETWIRRLRAICPITAISLELVKFDTQKLQNPEIDGIEYQQGELFGYEVWEYLLEKWGHKCAYCGIENVPLEKEHIIPKSRHGSYRVSNLTVSCRSCNEKKGNQTSSEFGHPEVQEKAKNPLRDATAVNATRWEIYRRLQSTGLPVEVGTGGRTKFNRTQRRLPKAHWLDATCVGESTPERLKTEGIRPLLITATGHGSRQMCGTNKYGFPIRHRTRQKKFFSFQTGDIVIARIPKGKYAGIHTGRVTVRNRPSFRLNGFDVHQKYLTAIHHADGYSYN